MPGPNYQDRCERNYQVGVSPDRAAKLADDLSELLPKHGLELLPGITCIGTVFLDNKDYDLTRYTVINGGRHILVRLRTYETYGDCPKPISEYWVEVKIRDKERWRKKRFRLHRTELADFFEGRELGKSVFNGNPAVDADDMRKLYRETQEIVLTMGLKPFFLLTYKRVAFQNEIERLSLDWDIRYHQVGAEIFGHDSWRYPAENALGRSDKTILEIKCPRDHLPAWIGELESRYAIQKTGFLKIVEGMEFLFRGPLRSHDAAKTFLQAQSASPLQELPIASVGTGSSK